MSPSLVNLAGSKKRMCEYADDVTLYWNIRKLFVAVVDVSVQRAVCSHGSSSVFLLSCFWFGGFCLFFVCCDLWFSSAPDRPETTPAVWLTDLGLTDFGFLTFWKGRKSNHNVKLFIWSRFQHLPSCTQFWNIRFILGLRLHKWTHQKPCGRTLVQPCHLMTLHCKRRAFASTANICSVWRNGAVLRRWRKADMVWLPNDKTFDGSEKNEITSLTSWEITLSLTHTHTRTQILVFTRPLCPSQHIKTERRLGNESRKLLNEYQNAAAAWFHLRATFGAKEIDGRTFISKMSGIWGGAEAKSSVADYSCLCVSVFPAHFQHLTEISVSYTTVWEAVSLPF